MRPPDPTLAELGSGMLEAWRRNLLRNVTPWILASLPIGALVLWALSLPGINPNRMSDLGLISVMPSSVLIAFGLLAVGFGLSLRLPAVAEPLMLLYVLCWILMAFGIGSLIYEVPRFPTTYVTAGIAETISRTGHLFPLVDARFDWPVFFSLLAFITQISGFENAIQLADWVPVLSNILYLMPLLVVFRSLTADRRVVWLAVWMFYVANWIGQDYMSPQGFNIFLYLAILAILMRWFSVPHATSIGWLDRLRTQLFGPLRADAQPSLPNFPFREGPTAGWQRAGLVLLVVVLYSVAVSSHQLTPFVLLGGVTALVVLRRCTLRGLPVLMAVLLGIWLSFMATTYLGGHLAVLARGFFRADDVAAATLGARVQGSLGHIEVAYLRLAMTAGVWLLAIVGAVRRLRRGYWDVTAGILAAVPFGAILLQSYGGEVMLRVYLFSLPFVSFFAAAAFYPSRGHVSGGKRTGSLVLRSDVSGAKRTGSLVLLTATLMACLVVARYGNDRAEQVTAAEVGAVNYVYEIARQGDQIVAATVNSPLLYREFERNPQVVYALDHFKLPIPAMPSQAVIRALANKVRDLSDRTTYLIITRSQIAGLELSGQAEPGGMERLIEGLRRLPDFRVLMANADAIVFAVGPPGDS